MRALLLGWSLFALSLYVAYQAGALIERRRSNRRNDA
jgi:hypothetical protein